jgi:hypothetical protein
LDTNPLRAALGQPCGVGESAQSDGSVAAEVAVLTAARGLFGPTRGNIAAAVPLLALVMVLGGLLTSLEKPELGT